MPLSFFLVTKSKPIMRSSFVVRFYSFPQRNHCSCVLYHVSNHWKHWHNTGMIKTTAFIIQSQGFVPPKKGTENTEILFLLFLFWFSFAPTLLWSVLWMSGYWIEVIKLSDSDFSLGVLAYPKESTCCKWGSASCRCEEVPSCRHV